MGNLFRCGYELGAGRAVTQTRGPRVGGLALSKARTGARAASCVFLTKTQEQEGGSTLCRLRRGDRVVLRKRATVLYVIMKVVGQIFQDVVVGAAQRLSYLPGNPLVLVFLRAGGRGRAVDADVLVAMTCVKINRCVGGTR